MDNEQISALIILGMLLNLILLIFLDVVFNIEMLLIRKIVTKSLLSNNFLSRLFNAIIVMITLSFFGYLCVIDIIYTKRVRAKEAHQKYLMSIKDDVHLMRKYKISKLLK
jgi:hypothetical protein